MVTETPPKTFISATSSTCAFSLAAILTALISSSSALPNTLTDAFIKGRDDMLGDHSLRVHSNAKAYNTTFFEDTLNPQPVGNAGRVFTLGSSHQHQRGIVSPVAWAKHARGDPENSPQPDDLPAGHDVMKRFMEVRLSCYLMLVRPFTALTRRVVMSPCPYSILSPPHWFRWSSAISPHSIYRALAPIVTGRFLPSRSTSRMLRRNLSVLLVAVCSCYGLSCRIS